MVGMAVTSALAAGSRAVAPRLLAVFVAVVVVVVQYRQSRLVVMLLAVLTVVILAYVARRHVAAATAVGLVVIAAVPVYAGRYVGGTQFGVTPALVVAIVLAPSALQYLPSARLVPMDVAVAIFCLLRVASTFLNLSNRLGAALGPALYVAMPYLVFRLLTLRTGIPRVMTRAVVVAGAAAGLFAILEHSGLGNVFFRLPSNGYQYQAFAQEQLRFGEVRAEASFGHSIALGMFLALALVLAVALAVETRQVLARAALAAAAGLMLVGTLDTLSRGAILMLAVGVAMWFFLESRRLQLSTVLGVLVAGTALVLLTPVSSTVSQLVSSSQGDTNEAASTQHRVAILDLVRDPGEFSLLGQRTTGVGSVTDQVEARTGLGSFDNAFALVYLANGLLAVLAFLAVGVIAFATLGSGGLTNLERAWVAGLCAATLNLFTVNLLTQFSDFYWVAAAISASAWQRVRLQSTARNDELARRSL
jgi:hypothetical protein